ncbi:UDP-GalNAc:beta-1,3-N-acetylgalactosaminyltransferase 2-like isoform X2 [Cimex lectularius]|uniref:Hexosyltransferase n=1 Tax=Cimex lectularius TaxID=79782 RepID=A0A8I6SA66_CIMLE|nr:UDP-GalNAc:beta-1,3-N-acetylgalactosaminyltransferase 2-like isoform X2 [Cimex lectularius]
MDSGRYKIRKKLRIFFILLLVLPIILNLDNLKVLVCFTVDLASVNSNTILSLTEQTSSRHRICVGFTFMVRHTMSLEMLGISSSLRRVRKERMYRVELHDSQRGEKVVSATFIISGSDSPSGFTWKKVPKIVFNEGFEGEIKIISDDDYTNLNCTHKFLTNGIVTIFEVVDTKGFFYKFEPPNCPIASFLYQIMDVDKLQNHINETSVRQILWDEEVGRIENSLKEEKNKYSDLLIIDTIDVYTNLPIKLSNFMQWATTGDKFKYIIKTDDDVFLDIKKIQLQFSRLSDWDWWSCFKVGWPPPNSGKWRDRLTDESVYPKFPSGSGYVLKNSIAKKVLNKPPMNVGEDVSMGFWILEQSPLDLIESQCFWACSSKCNKNPCNMPELKVDEMYTVWKDYNKCGEICNCSP